MAGVPVRSGKYAPTPWAERRLYRPFVIASLGFGLTLGFTLGATMLVSSVTGSAGVAWVKLLQPHGVAQIFGWAGLFVMGVAMHVVPRFRGDAAVRFPWPQRAILGLVVAGIVLRAAGQARQPDDTGAALLVASGFALFAGVLVFAVTLGEVLRKGRAGRVRVEHWLWTGVGWGLVAAGLHLWIVLDMALNARLAADPGLDHAFIWVGIAGFITAFIFGISRRAVSGFLALRPVHARLDACSCALLNAGLASLVVAGVADPGKRQVAPGMLLLATGLLLFVVGLRIFEPSTRAPAGSVGSYPRYGRFLRAAYGWLASGAALVVVSALSDLSLVPAVRLQALAPLHTIAMGFITMAIMGFAGRALPLFEHARVRSGSWLDVTFVALNASVVLRLVCGLTGLPGARVGLALSGALGLIALVCFAAFVRDVLRPEPVIRPESNASPTPVRRLRAARGPQLRGDM